MIYFYDWLSERCDANPKNFLSVDFKYFRRGLMFVIPIHVPYLLSFSANKQIKKHPSKNQTVFINKFPQKNVNDSPHVWSSNWKNLFESSKDISDHCCGDHRLRDSNRINLDY
jgi:hypothetical protein